MEMLRRVSEALTATTVGPTALLQGVAHAVIGVSGAASCLITLTTGGGPAEPVIEGGVGGDPSVHGQALNHVSPRLVTQVLIERRPAFSADIPLGRPLPPY